MWHYFCSLLRGPPWSSLFPYTTLFRSGSVLCAYCSGLEQFHNAPAATLRKSTSTGDATLSANLNNSDMTRAQARRLLLKYDSNLGGSYVADAGARIILNGGNCRDGTAT